MQRRLILYRRKRGGMFYIEDTELGFALEDASDTGLGSPFSTDPTAE